MNQRKINSTRSKLGRLARSRCANYKSGSACDLQRCGLCTVEIKTDSMPGNICPYFMRNVLPADPALMGNISNIYRPIIRYRTSRTGRENANVAAIDSIAKVTGNYTAPDVRLKMKRKIVGEGIVIIVIDREKE